MNSDATFSPRARYLSPQSRLSGVRQIGDTKSKLWHPLNLLYIGMLLGPVTLSVSGRTPALHWVDVALGLLFIQWLLTGGMGSKRKHWILPRAFMWMLMYSIIAALSLMQADDLLHSAATAKLLIMPAFVFLIAYSFLRNRADVEHALTMLTIVGLYMGVTALLSWNSFFTGAAILKKGLEVKDMVQTVTGRSNTVAGVNALLVPAALVAIMIPGSRWKRILGVLALIALLVSIVFSQSRGAFLALIAAALLFLPTPTVNRSRVGAFLRRFGALLLIGIIAASAMAIFPQQLGDTLQSRFSYLIEQMNSNRDTNGRWVRWTFIVQRLTPSLVGIGVGNYADVYEAGYGQQMGGSAHNLFLDTMVELGPLGLMALLAYLWTVGRHMRSLLSNRANAREQIVNRALVMTFAVYLLDVLVEPNYYSPVFSYIVALTMAAGVVLSEEARSRSPRGNAFVHLANPQLPQTSAR